MPDTNNFYMAGNMGGALSLGLGAAIAGKKVVVCGGDAEFVMHMGGLTTAGRYKNLDLTYILFDNEQNKSTGGQNTYQSHVDYIGIAKASNLDAIDKIIQKPDELINTLDKIDNKSINFIHVKCGLDDETPRPPLEVVKVSEFK
jgi:phosphonopyruvate decarboxylase